MSECINWVGLPFREFTSTDAWLSFPPSEHGIVISLYIYIYIYELSDVYALKNNWENIGKKGIYIIPTCFCAFNFSVSFPFGILQYY